MSTDLQQADLQRVVDAVWRAESARIIAVVARMVRDVGVAEELAHDTLIGALERWPASGLPDNPAAWLMTAAKHRAIDWLRRGKMIDRKHAEIGMELQIDGEADPRSLGDQDDDFIDDDLLRLMFVACHPVLSTDARVALTLRLLGGLTTEEIARAFLASEPTIAQRIVRAKRTLAAAKVPFEVPVADARAARLASVLDVVYLIFNEGYAATAGDHAMRPALCNEALRLGRLLAELMPHEAEVHGLLALMELQSSRMAARTDGDGEPVLLADQDRACWDRFGIERGLRALDRAAASGAPGAYTLQSAIAACHARARRAEDTDWTRIVALYDALSALAPSPVVALNRAVAVAMRSGPAAGLGLVEALAAEGTLARYHLLHSVRGELLERLGRPAEAQAAFATAATLAVNRRDKALMAARAATAAGAGRRPGSGP